MGKAAVHSLFQFLCCLNNSLHFPSTWHQSTSWGYHLDNLLETWKLISSQKSPPAWPLLPIIQPYDSTSTVYNFSPSFCQCHISCVVDCRPAEEQQGWMSYLGKALATPASILPATVSVTIRYYVLSTGCDIFLLLLHFRSLMRSLRVEHLLSSNYPKQVNNYTDQYYV